MKRSLPLLLTTATLAAAQTACGPSSPDGRGSGGAAAPGSARASGPSTAATGGGAGLPGLRAGRL
jgi:hypothetical protein